MTTQNFFEFVKQSNKAGKLKPAARKECPLNREELGNKTWGLLHTMAAKYPNKPTKAEQQDMTTFFQVFSNFYPCDGCTIDLQKEIMICPPKVGSQAELSLWLCNLHNKVNKKVGKKEFNCSKVNERWRDGWIDGSCG